MTRSPRADKHTASSTCNDRNIASHIKPFTAGQVHASANLTGAGIKSNTAPNSIGAFGLSCAAEDVGADCCVRRAHGKVDAPRGACV